METFLKEHADVQSALELEHALEIKKRRIEELEYNVAEFEDFLRQNPDVGELHGLRCRVKELETWIENGNKSNQVSIDRARIAELEQTVSHLEEYVEEQQDVQLLREKLQDREGKLQQLRLKVVSLERHLSMIKKDPATTFSTISIEVQCDLFNEKVKMKEMEHAIAEKDNKILEYEQQLAESKDEVSELRNDLSTLAKELREYEAEDIGVLKEEIRVRDEKVLQLEEDVDSLERALNERIEPEEIEELVDVIKKKEEREENFEKYLVEKDKKIEELSTALRESVVLVGESERKFRIEEKIKNQALEMVSWV